MDVPDGPPRTVCTSCGGLNDQRDRCACVISRASAVASLAYELHRAGSPSWRRPRRWTHLPQRSRAALVHDGLDLVEALEGHGWRLVRMDRAPAGVHELAPRPVVDPESTSPLEITDPGKVVPKYVDAVPASQWVDRTYPAIPGPLVPYELRKQYAEHARALGLDPERWPPGDPIAQWEPLVTQWPPGEADFVEADLGEPPVRARPYVDGTGDGVHHAPGTVQ